MATSTSESERAALRLADRLESEGPAALAAEVRGRLFAALVRAYWVEREESASPFAGEVPEGIQVLVAAADMLRAAELTSFELAALCNV
jgi:hypothetical protein